MSSICGHEKSDGGTCEAGFGLCPDCGKCWSHCPHREEERQEARKRGGEATRKRYGAEGLRDEELPPLDGPEAAERWLEIIGRAVGTGRLSYKDGSTMIKAVREFITSQKVDLADKLDRVEEQLEEVKARQNRQDLRSA